MTPEGATQTSSIAAWRFAPEDLVTASVTDVGRVRSNNQDSYGEFSDGARGYRLLFVADGMGGHRGGEVASRLAVECVEEIFGASTAPPDELLRLALESANSRIFETASRDPELAGMGTTGVALILTGESKGWIAHVGDSRAYLLRNGLFSQLTADHSVVGELVRRGQLTPEEARVHPQSNEILRALGTQAEVDVELTPVDVEPGDLFLLCSDGLSGMLPDPQIGETLTGVQPEQAVRSLVQMANEAGGTDNITVQIAAVPDVAADAEPAGAQPVSDTRPSRTTSLARWGIALAVVLVVALYFLSRAP